MSFFLELLKRLDFVSIADTDWYDDLPKDAKNAIQKGIMLAKVNSSSNLTVTSTALNGMPGVNSTWLPSSLRRATPNTMSVSGSKMT